MYLVMSLPGEAFFFFPVFKKTNIEILQFSFISVISHPTQPPIIFIYLLFSFKEFKCSASLYRGLMVALGSS